MTRATGGKYCARNFRTTFATEVAKQTKDPYMVQRLMGHKQVSSATPYILLSQEYGRKIKEVELYV